MNKSFPADFFPSTFFLPFIYQHGLWISLSIDRGFFTLPFQDAAYEPELLRIANPYSPEHH